MNVSVLRYKFHRMANRLLLGPLFGRAVGTNLTRDLEEGMGSPDIASHVLKKRTLSKAYVQHYDFPETFPDVFPRRAAFDDKIAYLLKDVTLSPHDGLMWLPGKTVLQQSIGSVPRFYGALRNALGIPRPLKNGTCVVPMADTSYYHVLIESLAQVLHACEVQPEIKVLLERKHHAYLDGILDFVGIPPERRLLADNPVYASRAVLVPRWVNGGFNLQCDLDILRQTILPRIGSSSHSKKLYLSRSRAANRPLDREHDLEQALAGRGFEICFFETLPFAEQMAAIHHADIIVAPHGAGLANLIAARPGTAVVEILSPNWFNTCYAKMAVQMGLLYRYAVTEPQSGGRFAIRVPDVLAKLDLQMTSTRNKSL